VKRLRLSEIAKESEFKMGSNGKKWTGLKSLFMVLLMGFSLFAACSSTPISAKSDSDTVKVTMWGWNAGDIQKIMAEYIKQTGAKVTFDYVTVQQAECFQKLQTTIGAGLDMPDIVPSEIGQRGTMMSLDIWEDLSKKPYNFKESTTFDYFMPLCKNEKGQLVCLPWDISTAALAYKKDLAKKYLGTDDPAQLQKMLPDWDAFKKVGLNVYNKSNGKIFMFASLSNVKQIIDGQNPATIIKNNKLDMNSSVKKTIARMIDFRNSKIVDNIIETSPAYNASYADDIHIFYPCASWSPNYVIDPNDPKGIDSWGLMIPPGGCFSWGGSGHMIPKKAKHKMEAYKFISWLISKEGTISQKKTVNYNIANREAYNDPDFAQMSDKNFGKQNLGKILFVDAMKNIKVRPVSVHDVAILDTWNLVTEAINNDKNLDFNGAVKMFEQELRNKIPDLK
jgi:multiple sugar transport system substrate-binding protein